MKKKPLTLREMTLAALFGAATAAGAYLIIPLPPVPITLQTLVLCVAAALLGARLGALSQVVYLILGLIGLPVFAGGKAGLGVLFGPTGGYLIGFVLGAWLIGKLVAARPHWGFWWLVVAMSVGHLLIYALGTARLAWVADLSWQKAVMVGAVPFLPGDALKIAAAAWLARMLRKRVRILKHPELR